MYGKYGIWEFVGNNVITSFISSDIILYEVIYNGYFTVTISENSCHPLLQW